jgi:5'-3' exoribonuclease 1
MGIPHYFRHVAERHPEVLTRVHAAPCCSSGGGRQQQQQQRRPDRVYLDFNSIVHMCAAALMLRGGKGGHAGAERGAEGAADGAEGAERGADGAADGADGAADGAEGAADGAEGERLWDAIIAATLRHLDHLAARLCARQLFMVAVDGVPPRAKMNQQRNRRYMAALRRDLGGGGAPPAWDGNAITPGTAFMARLDGALARWAAAAGAAAPGRAAVVVSGSNEPEEGEQKIFGHLREQPLAPGESACVYGLDADLFMMALVSPARDGLRLVREQELGGALQAVDVATLARGVREVLLGPAPCAPPPQDGRAQEGGALDEYALLCSLMGNDFVPSLPCLRVREGAVDVLVRARDDAGRPALVTRPDADVGAGELPWCPVALAALLRALADREDALMRTADARYRRCCERAARGGGDPVEDYPVRTPSDALAVRAAGHGAWRLRFYRHVFGTSDAAAVKAACLSYLAGVAWSFAYMRQRPVPRGWYYAHAYAPTALDLHNVLVDDGAGAPGVRACLLRAAAAPPPPARIDARLWQLLMVLPPGSAPLLPARLRRVMTDDALECRHLYPSAFRVTTYLREKLWECQPRLPVMDERLLAAAVAAAPWP